MIEREKALNEKIKKLNQSPAQTETEKTYLGFKADQLNKMGGNIPGF